MENYDDAHNTKLKV